MNDPLRKQVCKTLFALQGYSADQIIEGTYQTYPCIEVHVRKEDEPRCPTCGIVGAVYDHRVRKILHASISCRPVVLVLTLRRINCAQCGVKTEQQDIAEGLNRHSKDFGNKVLQFTLRSDNASVARIFGVDRSTIYRIDKIELSKLEKGYRGRVPNVDQIAIDEIGYKRRHKYATVITNHEDGCVIDLTMGKSKESAKELFRKYERRLRWIDTVTMDFSGSYIGAVSECWSADMIVFDRFHFSRLVNRKVEEVRRELQRDFESDKLRQSKKHDRWLVLTRKHNHKENHQARLKKLETLNHPLYEAYLLKEDLLSIFEDDITQEEAKPMIEEWCRVIQKTVFEPLKALARTIMKRLHIVLNWFKHRITNAKAEAVNNVIRTIIKRAYGYKDFSYFRLKVLQCCGYLNTHSPT